MNKTTREFKKVVVGLEKSQLPTGEKVIYANQDAEVFVCGCDFSQLSKQHLLQLISLQFIYQFMDNNKFLYKIYKHYKDGNDKNS